MPPKYQGKEGKHPTFTRVIVEPRMSETAPRPLILRDDVRELHPLWVHLPEFAPAPIRTYDPSVINRITKPGEDDD